MNEVKNQALYRLIREYLYAMGTSRTTVVAIQSYIDAIRRLRCTPGAFKGNLLELGEIIKRTEPQVTPLVLLIEQFNAEIQRQPNGDLESAKVKSVEILSSLLKRFEDDTEKLSRNCMNCIESGDFIVAHSSTAYIRNAFARAFSELNRKFKVLVLKQDFLRTKDLINILESHRVDHLLIPEYNLSHFLKDTNKLFIGAVSVTADHKAVAGIGTANVVSLCHSHNVPVYLFVETIKFSHTTLPEHHIYKEEKEKIESDYPFRITTFSHDFIDLGMVDHLITENGEMAEKPGS